MYKFGIYLSVVQVISAQQNGSKFTQYSNIHYRNSFILIQFRKFNDIY